MYRNGHYQWQGTINNGEEFSFFTTRFKALKDTPKTYKQIGVFSVPSLSNNYNSGLFYLYKAKNGDYRVGTYRDGCFWEQFAKASFSNEALQILAKWYKV